MSLRLGVCLQKVQGQLFMGRPLGPCAIVGVASSAVPLSPVSAWSLEGGGGGLEGLWF